MEGLGGITLISPFHGEPFCHGEGEHWNNFPPAKIWGQMNTQTMFSSAEKLEHKYERVGS